MSVKLLVHKFEKGVNFKSLHILIEQNDDGSAETTFGPWLDGRVEPKNKDIEKSRFVVKVVTEEDFNNFGLNLFSYNTEDIDTLVKTDYKLDYNEKYTDHDNFINFTINGKSDIDCSKKCDSRYYLEEHQGSFSQNDIKDTRKAIKNQIILNPLEHSIEKVKENNAKIMENIHMLNRTLNYTKKKEILDMINPKPLHSYPCNECGKCFVYETGLRRHFFIRHKNLDTHPRWQTVWTCPECFQVWPRKDFALAHSGQCCHKDNSDYVREIKTSLLLQCEFCEKVFTSIPRLLRHSKIHTIESNYECDPCGFSFPSYKHAEQHWLVCPWLQMNYIFSLAKMLLCNACDRKFRDYDHLYNHRYKVGHYFGKSHEDYNSSVSKLVYQCEECSQWFLETSVLNSHRNQYHQPRLNSGMVGNFESHQNSDSF